jgi:hypothetical protein
MWRTESPTLEVGALPAEMVGFDTDLLQAAVPGQPGVACDLGEIRVHAARFMATEAIAQFAEPPTRTDPQIGWCKRDLASDRWRHGISGFHACAA